MHESCYFDMCIAMAEAPTYKMIGGQLIAVRKIGQAASHG